MINPVCSKIDRFLVSMSCQVRVANFCQKQMQRIISDHFPISMEMDGIKWAPCPFRFDDKWLKMEDFHDKVRGKGVATNPSGMESYRVVQRLKVFKVEIKKRYNEVGSDIK